MHKTLRRLHFICTLISDIITSTHDLADTPTKNLSPTLSLCREHLGYFKLFQLFCRPGPKRAKLPLWLFFSFVCHCQHRCNGTCRYSDNRCSGNILTSLTLTLNATLNLGCRNNDCQNSGCSPDAAVRVAAASKRSVTYHHVSQHRSAGGQPWRFCIPSYPSGNHVALSQTCTSSRSLPDPPCNVLPWVYISGVAKGRRRCMSLIPS